jgi:hypothetical protein
MLASERRGEGGEVSRQLQRDNRGQRLLVHHRESSRQQIESTLDNDPWSRAAAPARFTTVERSRQLRCSSAVAAFGVRERAVMLRVERPI